MPIPLVVSIVGDAANLSKALDKGAGDADNFGRRFNAGAVLKVAAFAGVAVTALDALHGLAQAAREDALESDALALAVQNAGAATGDWSGAIDEAIAKGQELIFTDSQIREALTTLVGATGDMATAQEGLSLAQDLARLKHLDLAQAADAVAKAQGGSATSLAKLLKLSTEGKTATEILEEAQRLGAGQAELYGDAQANAAEKAQIKIDEAGESFGELVAAIESALVGVFAGFIGWLDEIGGEGGAAAALKRGIDKVAGAVRAFGAGIGVVVGWLRGLVEWAQNAADAVGDLIDSLGDLHSGGSDPVGNFIFGGGFQGPGLEALGDRATGAGVASSSTEITINTGADPDAVVRALIRWTSRNGGPGALTTILER